MRILAMGGGENGRPGKPYEIKKFDEEIVKMTGKNNPTFLFIAFTQNRLRMRKIIIMLFVIILLILNVNVNI